MPLTKRDILPLSMAGLVLVTAGWTTYLFFDADRWLGGVLFGLGVPLVGVVDWAFVRKQSEEARAAVDRMLPVFLLLVLGIGMVLESSQAREQACEERCNQVHRGGFGD